GRHFATEGGVDEPLNRRHAAIAGHQLEHAATALLELLADAPVGADVSTAEAINRLLGIADDEQLAADRPCLPALGHAGIVGREEQQDFRLNRIGVLELVDEDARELR